MADGDAKTEAMLDRAQFHAMVEGTPEDWQAIARANASAAAAAAQAAQQRRRRRAPGGGAGAAVEAAEQGDDDGGPAGANANEVRRAGMQGGLRGG